MPALALGEAVVVRSNETDFLVFHPLFEGNNVFGHIPNLFDGSATLDIEGVDNIFGLGADCSLVSDIVGNGPHLLPVELFGIYIHAVIKVGLINIEVHHAGIRTSDLCEVGIAETATYLGGATPFLEFFGNSGIAAFNNAGNDSVTLAVAVQVGYHFAYSACSISFAEPGGNICMLEIETFQFLHIYQDNRYIQILHGGKHVVRSAVGQQLEYHQVNVGSTELVAGSLTLFLGGHNTAVDEFNCLGKTVLEVCILFLEFRYQAGELGGMPAMQWRTHPLLLLFLLKP